MWSKVKTKSRKPIMWWVNKILCEIGWYLRRYDFFRDMCYYHLNVMCKKYKINLYGESL